MIEQEVCSLHRCPFALSGRHVRCREMPVVPAPAGNRRSRGQALVEFSLVIPIFLTLIMAVVEFAFGLNASLTVGYASRDAALVATEAGNTSGADCLILRAVESRIGAPASAAQITSVEIYWSDQNGVLKGAYRNVYTRTGSTT